MAIKIVLADDHNIVREGLRTVLNHEPDLEVVGEANDGRTTVRLARELRLQLVIMDISMPDLNGIEATRQILSESPSIKVIALSMHSDRQFILNMLKAGASGYLLKDCALEELIRAIRTVMRNQIYLSPAISGAVVKDLMQGTAPGDSAFTILTVREREVLQLLAEGKSTQKIAAALNVSVKTVETHRQQIMRKLEIHTVAELTKYAIRQGLTSLGD
jgi:DNA-binding NarL/FixJ family response regulator